jgi:hypothetical protein
MVIFHSYVKLPEGMFSFPTKAPGIRIEPGTCWEPVEVRSVVRDDHPQEGSPIPQRIHLRGDTQQTQQTIWETNASSDSSDSSD